MSPKMTTTSYAVLALLDLRPWTGYELANQAARSLRYAWPKSERLLYNEPKKLVELGHATVIKEEVGRRTRNVYAITDQGRSALAAWSEVRTAPPQFEAEALLRLLFAEHGSVEDLRRALGEFEADTRQLHADVIEMMNGYLRGEHPFPNRTHLSVLFATFQLELFTVIENWIQFARDEIDDWPATENLGMNQRTRILTEHIAAGGTVLERAPSGVAEKKT